MRILHSGTGTILGAAYLPSTPDSVIWGRLPCAEDEPSLEIEAGTVVTIDTLSHEGILEDQGRAPIDFFAAHGAEHVLDDAVALAASDVPHSPDTDGPHVVCKPIRIVGARRGDVLAISVLETTPRVPYGVISNRHGKGALPDEYPQAGLPVFSAFASVSDDGHYGRLRRRHGSSDHVQFPLAPFLGIMGVAVPGSARPHSVPPGRHGGNLDIGLLTTGSTLYLPVLVDGALAYVGDPHFAQGDGEVGLTAMEASLRVSLKFEVIARKDAVQRFGAAVNPVAENEDLLIPTGLNEDLDLAVQDCVREAIALLQSRFGMDPAYAYAYLSAATDFRISQVVDVIKGVHATIRKADFA